jgi:hypothetical protein
MDSEAELEGLDSVPLPNNHGWQRHLLYTTLGCLMLLTFAALATVLPELTRPPHLVYPPPVQATIEAFSIERTGVSPVDEETLGNLKGIFGIEDCQVGGKYGALCPDGTFEVSGLLRGTNSTMCARRMAVSRSGLSAAEDYAARTRVRIAAPRPTLTALTLSERPVLHFLAGSPDSAGLPHYFGSSSRIPIDSQAA